MKKKNWIVVPLALLLVFGLVLSGCETYVFPTDSGAYTIVELGPLTFAGGAPNNQKGWIIKDNNYVDDADGTVLGESDLDIEDLQGAEFLVVELKGAINGGIDLIWGTKGNGWNQTNIVSAGKAVEGKATFDDGVLTIDLAEALADYGAFLGATEDLRIMIQYWTPDFAALGLVKGYLLIPEPSDEFVPVTAITGVPASGYQNGGAVSLSDASYSPKSTANKKETSIIWTISAASPLKEIVYDSDGITVLSGSFTFANNAVSSIDDGFVILTATILGGAAPNSPYTQDFQIEFLPLRAAVKADPLNVKISADTITELGGIKTTVSSTLGSGSNENGYTVTSGVNYGQSSVSIKIEFDKDVYLTDYDTVTFTYVNIAGDAGGKQVYLLASATQFEAPVESNGFVYPSYGVTSGDLNPSNGGWLNGGGSPITGTIGINRALAQELDGKSALYIILYVGAGSSNDTTSYSISNIVLNPVDPK